jgi:hypothetical protein
MNSPRSFAPIAAALLGLLACGKGSGSIAPAEPKQAAGAPAAASAVSPLEIHGLYPAVAAAGMPFAANLDRSSMMGIAGSGFTRTCKVYFDDRPLRTDYQSPKAIVAVLPIGLIENPRLVTLTVRDSHPDRVSAPAVFRILPAVKAGEPIAISDLFPPATKAGVPFGVQADGRISLGVAGSGFRSSCVVIFDGVELETTFQGPMAMVAFPTPSMIAKARDLKVIVKDKDPGGASSDSRVFKVMAE